MKYLCEFMSEGCAAAAAVLRFVSASTRLKKPNRIRHGLESGLDDPRAVLIMVYKQSDIVVDPDRCRRSSSQTGNEWCTSKPGGVADGPGRDIMIS